jgi:hypothetical protein
MLWLLCMFFGVVRGFRLTRGLNTNITTIHVLVELGTTYGTNTINHFQVNVEELSIIDRDITDIESPTSCRNNDLNNSVYEITCNHLYDTVDKTTVSSKIMVGIHHYSGHPIVHELLNICPRPYKYICVSSTTCIENVESCL